MKEVGIAHCSANICQGRASSLPFLYTIGLGVGPLQCTLPAA